MSGKLPRFGVDACLLIAWQAEEESTSKEYRDGVHELLERVHKRDAVMVVSTIMRPECPLVPDLIDYLFTMKTRVIVVDVTRRIAERAAEYRKSFSIETPDAIHLATASLYESDVFYTTDKKLLRVKQVDRTRVALPPSPSQFKLGL